MDAEIALEDMQMSMAQGFFVRYPLSSWMCSGLAVAFQRLGFWVCR